MLWFRKILAHITMREEEAFLDFYLLHGEDKKGRLFNISNEVFCDIIDVADKRAKKVRDKYKTWTTVYMFSEIFIISLNYKLGIPVPLL